MVGSNREKMEHRIKQGNRVNHKDVLRMVEAMEAGGRDFKAFARRQGFPAEEYTQMMMNVAQRVRNSLREVTR